MNHNSINDMMSAYCEDAIELSKQIGVELDFSEASEKRGLILM